MNGTLDLLPGCMVFMCCQYRHCREEIATPVLLLPVLMSSIETDEADRSTVSRPGTEPVSSSLPPTRSAVMVTAPALHQNLFLY